MAAVENKTLNGSVSRSVTVFRGGEFHPEERELIDETVFRITADGLPAGHLSCSPWNVREAVIGSLYMQDIIRSADDLRTLEISEETGEIRAITQRSASADVYADKSKTVLSAADVTRLADMLEERSRLFRRTGGVHCAAIAEDSEFLAYEEDVSRHAAVDKLAGSCLVQKIPMTGSCLVFSGRVPGEIIAKAVKMGCSTVIARGAPTDYACRVAEINDITLIGFAREDAFTIYTCPHRIISAAK